MEIEDWPQWAAGSEWVAGSTVAAAGGWVVAAGRVRGGYKVPVGCGLQAQRQEEALPGWLTARLQWQTQRQSEPREPACSTTTTTTSGFGAAPKTEDCGPHRGKGRGAALIWSRLTHANMREKQHPPRPTQKAAKRKLVRR